MDIYKQLSIALSAVKSRLDDEKVGSPFTSETDLYLIVTFT